MNKLRIKDLLNLENSLDSVVVTGWVRTKRDSKKFSFLEVNDGSCLKNLQVIVDAGIQGYKSLDQASTGAAVSIKGKLIESQGKNQRWEVHADEFELVGAADETFPLQKKGHTMEYLREIAHLRARSNLFGAVFRVRSKLAFAIHQFFQEKDFQYVHTPIITASDCEGAGEMFRVTTLNLENPPRQKDGLVDDTKDFFHKASYLTVSGQLEAEAFACSLGQVYTFGPTFRAENSHTSRHAAEFWMIEPEIAFCDIHGDMDLAEEFVKYLIAHSLENCNEDLELFNKFVDKGLLDRLKFVLEKPFQRITYTKAVEILKNSKQKFDYDVSWGANLQSEHERYLTEEHFKCPITVYDYPASIKPFYMRKNDDGKTVAAMDVLVPGIGEIIGGSQREERMEVLLNNLKEANLPEKEYWWYTDLRKYGSVPHSGFGLGFERMLMFVTGMNNIRDVIPFARTPGHAEF